MLLVLAVSNAAGATTIDFEELVGSPNIPDDSGPIISQGFEFIVPGGTSGGFGISYNDEGFPGNTGNYLTWVPLFSGSGTLEITTSSGNNFNLQASDFGFAAPDINPGYAIYGYYEDGSSISAIALGNGVDSWLTTSLDSGWSDLVRVEIIGCQACLFGMAIDNVVVTAVPIPGAVWLFLSGLAALGWVKRQAT